MHPVDEQHAPQCSKGPEPQSTGDAKHGDETVPVSPAASETGRLLGSDLVSEAEAYETYRHLLEDKELRRARQAGRIGYLRRKRTFLYRRDELDAFVGGLIERDYVPPCHQSSHAQSPPRTEVIPSRPSVWTANPELMDALRRRLAQRRGNR